MKSLNISNLAELKRQLVVGVKVKMIGNDWFPEGHLIGVERKVIRAQGNAIQFEPVEEGSEGSWLFHKEASSYTFLTGTNCFSIRLDDKENYLSYELIPEGEESVS